MGSLGRDSTRVSSPGCPLPGFASSTTSDVAAACTHSPLAISHSITGLTAVTGHLRCHHRQLHHLSVSNSTGRARTRVLRLASVAAVVLPATSRRPRRRQPLPLHANPGQGRVRVSRMRKRRREAESREGEDRERVENLGYERVSKKLPLLSSFIC